ncbi:DUF1295 domain-containing protein [Thiohalorhabdus methylotrophus]|uniref:DUF1295 domain-containing protein n=1 Tax=Thiohalorhabdus methylotrophus TaxID=3242694 RepID=A0ABV4TUI4_9GAMM
MSAWHVLGYGWAVMAALMLALWLVQWRTRNAGIVDVAWAAGVGLLGVLFALSSTGGDPARRMLIGLMAGLWGLRLAGHLARRVRGEAEDGRYRALRASWGSRTQPYMFLFFQVQALWAVMFAIPILVAARNPVPGPTWLDWLGLAIWGLAIGGEMLADHQLRRFRAKPGNRGRVCQEGLWHYSRHPNYFFEWLHWWAYVCLGLPGPYGWITLLGPAVMLVFLLKVTGIPPTEARALESRGEAYRRYQQTTNAFFPGPPRKTSGGNP